jgi:hypothetical protein
MRVEEEFLDVLQNIEWAIVAIYEDDPALDDRAVLAAIDALLRMYRSEGARDATKEVWLPGRARAVYDQCRRMCEWRLGRQPLNEGEAGIDDPGPKALSVSEIILCLQRIRKSIRLWHARGGRRGYLNYVREFFGSAALRRLGQQEGEPE